MTFCIPKHLVDLFLNKIKTGEITPEKLSEMTSQERHDYFKEFLGEANAGKVNSLFESKILLKSQQQGMINWAKQVAGIKPEVKRDMLSKVQKMTKILQPKEIDAFLADLAAQRLGVGVTVEEAGKIADLAKQVSDRKTIIKEDSPIRSKERMDYGTALVLFKEYVGDLKIEANKKTFKEFITDPAEWINTLGGVTKSIVASLDNSFFGRQGLVTLFNKPDIWFRNFKKSWGDMGKELRGIDAMVPIKADIYSRPNALNGKYQAQGLDIGLLTEEAFPSALPAKIPLFGRLYKASESAYNGAALRMRADLADVIFEQAEKSGVNVMDKKAGLGPLINSMTGRGKVDLAAKGLLSAKSLNVTLFSVKYVQSQLDVLSAHLFDKNVSPYARKQAAKNLIRVIGFVGGILSIAKWLDPDSVALDPRSSNFGKIMIGENRNIKINITAGMGSIITLASRLVPTKHNGKWGWWVKNSKGRYVQTNIGKYGVSSPIDLFVNFMTGKASPIARVLLDTLKGKNFKGEKVTVGGEAAGLTTPISISNLYELAKTPEGENVVLFSILSALELLGVGVNVQNKK